MCGWESEKERNRKRFVSFTEESSQTQPDGREPAPAPRCIEKKEYHQHVRQDRNNLVGEVACGMPFCLEHLECIVKRRQAGKSAERERESESESGVKEASWYKVY
jgi:hypothetical protein